MATPIRFPVRRFPLTTVPPVSMAPLPLLSTTLARKIPDWPLPVDSLPTITALLAALMSSPLLTAARSTRTSPRTPPDPTATDSAAPDADGPAGYRRLPVPSPADSRTENGVRWFTLGARTGSTTIVAGRTTATPGTSSARHCACAPAKPWTSE
ncbi:hypothetical protein AB0442_34765 [Kitasatospora sp. NPDC085895]|uniref:hypothetical protein n=1 Tax=Kitasatospora sp. NPDC085895 TaxID=3155057 RepID=UPI00344F0EEF